MPVEELPPEPEFTDPVRPRDTADLPPHDYDYSPVSRFGTLTIEDKQWGMFCHLSALLGLLVGGMMFLGPLICWLVKKDTSSFVDYHGKESLNFQLNILVYSLIAGFITVVTCGFGFPLLLIVLVYAIVMPIIAGLKANNGETYEYPATIRVIR